MTSQKQKQSGYLLPSDIDPPTRICVMFEIPDTDEYRRAVLGHIHQLGKWWNWEKSYTPTDRRAKEAAEVFRLALYETLVIGECGGDDLCCDDILEQLKQPVLTLADQTNSINNYSTIQNNYVTNNGDVSILYPELATPTVDTDQALCQAVRAIVDMACEYGIQWNQENGAISGAVGVGFGIAAAVAAYFTLGASVILGLALAGSGGGIYAAGTDIATAVLQDKEAREEVACCLFGSLQGQVPTASLFANALNGCGFDGGSNASQIAVVVAEFLKRSDIHAAFLDATNEALKLAKLDLLDDCQCGGEWCYTFDFTENSNFWSPVAGFSTYINGTGWRGDAFDAGGGLYDTINAIDISFTTSTITSVEVSGQASAASAGGSRGIYFDDARTLYGDLPTASDNFTSRVDRALDTNRIGVNVDISNSASNAFTLITRVTIRGVGENPFGNSNCE